MHFANLEQNSLRKRTCTAELNYKYVSSQKNTNFNFFEKVAQCNHFFITFSTTIYANILILFVIGRAFIFGASFIWRNRVHAVEEGAALELTEKLLIPVSNPKYASCCCEFNKISPLIIEDGTA